MNDKDKKKAKREQAVGRFVTTSQENAHIVSDNKAMKHFARVYQKFDRAAQYLASR